MRQCVLIKCSRVSTQTGSENRMFLEVLPGDVRVVIQYEATAVNVVVVDVVGRIDLNGSVPAVSELRYVLVGIINRDSQQWKENE